MFILTPLASEYQLAFLKRDCVKTFKKIMKTGVCPLKKQLDIYFFTEMYLDCREMLNFCADFLSQFSLATLLNESVYDKIQQKGIILERRLEMMEKVTTDESVRFLNENVMKMEKSCNDSVNTMAELKSQWTKRSNGCSYRFMSEIRWCHDEKFESVISCHQCLTYVHNIVQPIVMKRIDDMCLKPQNSDNV